MRREASRFGALLILGGLLGCQGPVVGPRSPRLEGDFASSQVKPLSSPRGPLPSLPVNVERRAARERYFAALGAGQTPAKADLLSSSAAPLEAGRRDLRAGPIRHLPRWLEAGGAIEVETRRLSAGADPVLHLWWREAGREVAQNDDDGREPGAARLRFRAVEAGTYLVILRGYATEDEGRCDLYLDGELVGDQVPFGGSTLAVAPHRRLHAVLLNDGDGEEPWPPSGRAARDPVLAWLEPGSGALLALDDDGGVELGAELASEGASAIALLGAYSEVDAGAARLVVNDAPLADADGDGLGDGLEAALCTCGRADEVRCGFDCRLAATPQDSDADGLGDAEELLGVPHPRFPQLLPRWGADPRHKDLFVEVDLADWEDAAVSPPVHRFGRAPTEEEARTAARVFARLSGMQNPDARDGIELHLDLGHACGPRASGIDRVCGDLCAHGEDGVRRCGQSRYPGPPAETRAGLAEGRGHLFHLAMSDCAVSGQAPGGAADFLQYDCDRVTALIHELGHNLGLAFHYGTPATGGGNCKPNYPSLMNYAYSDGFAGGLELAFSSGALVGKGDLAPHQLDETVPFGGPGAEVSWLAQRPFYFGLHDCVARGRGCKVDWNRDGRLDPSVRAHLSPMPGYGAVCEGTHGNALSSENVEGLAASSGPATAERSRRRADGSLAPALHVFAPRATTGGSALSVNVTFETSGGWSGWQDLPGLFRVDSQPAAATITTGGQEELWVVACQSGDDPIRAAVLDEEGRLSAFEPLPGQPAGLRARDVSLAVRGADLVLLARDESEASGDRVLLAIRGPAGWSPLVPVLAESRPLRSLFTPAVAVGPDGRIYVVSADPDPPPGSGPAGRIHLYSAPAADPGHLRDEELWGLQFEDGVPGHQHETWSRPALVFLPHRDGAGKPLSEGRGALWLFWNRGLRTRYLWTWGRLDAGGADFSLGRWHHYEAYGYTDFISGSGPALVARASGHLAALFAQSDLEPAKVRHVPFADGASEEKLVLRDFDDRVVIRVGLCAGLNAGCPERCRRLSDACADGRSSQPLSMQSCPLPPLLDQEVAW